MQILPDNTLVVKAPFFLPDILINKFIKDNSGWIEKQKQKVSQKQARVKKFANGERFLYLGQEYELEIGNFKEIRIVGEKLQFPNFLEFRIKKELNEWYVKQAKRIITEQIDQLVVEVGTKINGLTFSDTKSKWGSCTYDNRLQFCWRIVMAPLITIKYVVIHELVHTKEKNHGRGFWSKVRLYNPSYKQQIKWLRDNGHLLMD